MTGRKSTSTALPAARIVEVAVSRCPLIATASAPAAHSPFTTLCRSTSSTRLTSAGEGLPVVGSIGAGASVSVTATPGPLTAASPVAASCSRMRRNSSLPPPSAARWCAVTSRRSSSLRRCRSSVRTCAVLICSTSPACASARSGSAATASRYATASRNPIAARATIRAPSAVRRRQDDPGPWEARRAAASA